MRQKYNGFNGIPLIRQKIENYIVIMFLQNTEKLN
jgi:hypothetical protein